MKLFVVCLLCLLDFGYVIGKEITYYIGIREINWDYAPSGMNTISGKSIDDDEHASTFLQPGPNRIGRVYKKAVYLQYTDDSYAEEMKKPNWLGFLGPIMTAEVGDTMTIHLKNFASRPYTLHPHGVQYTKENEGAIYPDNSSKAQNKGDAVKPGESYTYTWDVVEDQGPTDWVEDCVTRVYHSHIDGPRDVYSGLVGPLIICKEGVRDGAKAKKYEEFILMFSVIDENLSWYLDDNINSYCTDPASVDKEDEDFQESNLMHSINGYMYGNLPGLSMCDNTKIKWYLFGMGNEVDIHSAYFHGQVLTHQRFRVDTLSLFPATMIEGEMITKNPGKWLLSCQVNDHLEGGMQAIYEVKNCTGKSKCSNCHWGVVRHYYIAAEEIIWDYGPTSINQFTGQKLDHPDSESATFFERGEKRIGGRYKKVVYIEYTDSTFTKRKERSSEEAHLGILGPVILAQVGDFIKVTFKNNASRPYSIQAHGVSYTKDMEGAVYKTDNNEELNTQSQASHVDPGDVFTYEWNVPRNVGSTIHDLNCLPWLYYSSVDVVRDTNSGLVGPLLVCMTLINNKQRGVAHNYFVMPNVFDENKSWYLEENIKLFTSSPHTVNKEDADFQESNMMHSINGYMYGNQPGLDMCTGDSIRWSMIGLGTEVDMHGIHFSGNTIQVHDVTRDVASVFPHISYAVIMNPDNEGPLIKANTGDEIHIIFKNKASRPYSMYAHGIMLADNEIKPAEPGHIVTYIWKIPNRSGPNRHEGDCVTWAYYSTVDQTKDLYSGLIGPLVICKKILLPFFLPRVSPSRFALLFMVFNENESWYLDENIKTYSNYPDEVKKDDEKFVESNLMHGINGRMYANLPGLTMHVGDDVMWHLIGLGNEVDIHTVHFHAHSFEYKTGVVYRSDVFDLFPGTFQTVKFTAKNPGTWLLHCHVSYHIHSGMEALYTVLEKKETLKKLLNLHLDI
ncbi:ceruloplasmin-like isoform X2 [Pseudophryne corroboree]|uniref:ceruloplasmin-like isoform X2 n=1 Tax=Pseudophryne corroboree TaxID=495146 RepID=UPI0030817602